MQTRLRADQIQRTSLFSVAMGAGASPQATWYHVYPFRSESTVPPGHYAQEVQVYHPTSSSLGTFF